MSEPRDLLEGHLAFPDPENLCIATELDSDGFETRVTTTVVRSSIRWAPPSLKRGAHWLSAAISDVVRLTEV